MTVSLKKDQLNCIEGNNLTLLNPRQKRNPEVTRPLRVDIRDLCGGRRDAISNGSSAYRKSKITIDAEIHFGRKQGTLVPYLLVLSEGGVKRPVKDISLQ